MSHDPYLGGTLSNVTGMCLVNTAINSKRKETNF